MLSTFVGQIGHPFLQGCAWFLGAFYALIPNYAVAITLATVTVMLLALPLTVRATRSVLKMQVLAPELKVIRKKWKDAERSQTADRGTLRRCHQEELMAFYKEHNVSPSGGLLPSLAQAPIFIVLYATIHGLIHQAVVHGKSVAVPLHIGHGTAMFTAIQAAHGRLVSFGVNLADSIRTPGLGWAPRIPILAMVLLAVALQYIQTKQMTSRTASETSPELRRVQWILPVIFTVVYLAVPVGLNVYIVVSSLFRIAQQELICRRDREVQASLVELRARTTPG